LARERAAAQHRRMHMPVQPFVVEARKHWQVQRWKRWARLLAWK
jgi:hypothetical protein